MAKEPGKLTRVAWLRWVTPRAAPPRAAPPRDFASVLVVAACGLGIGGCGPRVAPDRPFPEEAVVEKPQRPQTAARGSGHQVVIGELCPRGAAGRPAVAPLLMHTMGWTDAVADVNGAVERGAVPRFVVFGVDGKAAGAFDTVGLADIALGQSVAAGAYAGGPPCSSDAGQGQRTDDAHDE